DIKLTPEETKVLFSKPSENEQYQIEFKDYTVKSLLAEAYFLSRDDNERAIIDAALNFLEKARIYDRDRIMLEQGKLPPGGRARFTFSGTEKEAEEAGLSEQTFQAGAVKTQLSMLLANHKNFEDDVYRCWELWHKRKHLMSSDLPKRDPPPVVSASSQEY